MYTTYVTCSLCLDDLLVLLIRHKKHSLWGILKGKAMAKRPPIKAPWTCLRGIYIRRCLVIAVVVLLLVCCDCVDVGVIVVCVVG